MTKLYTMTNGEEVTYKELQTVAGDFGIKKNQKAEKLIALIAEASAPVVEVDHTPVTLDADDIEARFNALNDEEDSVMNPPIGTISINGEKQNVYELEGSLLDMVKREKEASEPKASEQPVTQQELNPTSEAKPSKLFEFVRADNLIVHFRQAGKDVKMGWSKKDGRFYLLKDGKAKFYAAQTAIDKFKQFKDGKHGDVKRIVHALVRIRTKPQMIMAIEKKIRDQKNENVSRSVGKENASATNRRRSYQPIDAQWLTEYKEAMGDNFDTRKVREAYESYLAN